MVRNPAAAAAVVATLLFGCAAAALAGDCQPPPTVSSTRPDSTAPTKVKVGLFLIDLRSIDVSEQAFTADFHVALSWKDPRLVADPDRSLAGCTVPLSSIWNPRAGILNEGSLRSRLPNQAVIDSDGNVLARQRFVGELTFPFALHDYPFDSHQLRIEILSMGYTVEEVVLVVDRERSGRGEKTTIADWSLGEGSVVSESFVAQPMGKELARIVFQVEVERLRGTYHWKVQLTLCLIVAMSWAAFWIDPSLAPRIGIATTSVLTLIAFHFSLAYLLPRLPYLTLGDRVQIGATVLVFLAYGATVATSYLAAKEREELAGRITRHCRWLFPLGLGLGLVFLWLWKP